MIYIKLFIVYYVDTHFEVVSVTLREKFSVFVTNCDIIACLGKKCSFVIIYDHVWILT